MKEHAVRLASQGDDDARPHAIRIPHPPRRPAALMGAASVDGRSIVIHAREDDFSDPAGNSGARVACGVIESDMMRM